MEPKESVGYENAEAGARCHPDRSPTAKAEFLRSGASGVRGGWEQRLIQTRDREEDLPGRAVLEGDLEV